MSHFTKEGVYALFFTSQPNVNRASVATQIGFALELLNQTDRKKLSLATIDAFVLPPVRLGQAKFYFCHHSGAPRAYVTYAYLSDDVHQAFVRGDLTILHLSEWNEGIHLWIMDVVAPFGNLKLFLKSFLSDLAESPTDIHWGRSRTQHSPYRHRKYSYTGAA